MTADRKLPPPAPPANQQRLPLPPGTVIGKVSKAQVNDPQADYLTDFERAVLLKGGWQPGQPIPDLTKTQFGAEMTERFNAIRRHAETSADNMTPLPPDTPPVRMPDPVDISSLPPEKQRELRDAIAQAMQAEQVAKAQTVPQTISHIPGMAEAYATAVGGPAPPPIAIVDDSASTFNPTVTATPTPPPAALPVVAGPTTANLDFKEEIRRMEEEQRFHQEQQAKLQEEMKVAAAADPGDSAGGEIPPPEVCPKCGHHVRLAVVEFTQQDKEAFVATLLGSTRFRKEYEMFAGNIVLTLRSLTPDETDMILFQLDQETIGEQILSRAQYVRRMADYKLAASIERLARRGGAVHAFKPITEVAYDKTKYKTPLPQLLEYLHGQVFITDHVRRVCGQQWVRFQDLFELLEQRQDDPDFYEGTGLAR